MHHFSLPLDNPVLIFTFILLVIFALPALFNRIRIPGMLGLILAGILAGPNGFNILARDQSMQLLGSVGLVYIMFLAGLEVDIFEFRKNRLRSLVYGAATFLIPMLLGTLVSLYLMNLSMPASILLGSVFGSHTMLVYPIISRLGLAKTEPVTISVGGTLVAEIGSLLVLALIVDYQKAGTLDNYWVWLRLGGGITLLAFVVMWVFPRLARLFFRNVYSEGGARFLFTLLLIFGASSLAELLGIEPIIGALLAGLALNPLIPETSTLKGRLDFTGNFIFIPFFLISTGMLADPSAFIESYEVAGIALIVTVAAIFSKFVAAYFYQKIMGYSASIRNVMFALSNTRAAAALVVVTVGMRIELFDQTILNVTIFLIVFSSLLSSLVAEYSGKRMVAEDERRPKKQTKKLQRVMVPIGNPESVEHLLELAQLIQEKNNPEPIFALTIVADESHQNQGITEARKMVEKAVHHAIDKDSGIEVVSRIDLNIPGGIQRSARELLISEVVIGWNAKITARDKMFGTVLDNLLHHLAQMVMVCKVMHPLNTMNRVVIALPQYAELEEGFGHWLSTVRALAGQLDCSLRFIVHETSVETLEKSNAEAEFSGAIAYATYSEWDDFLRLSLDLKSDDLFVLIHPRPYSVSHSREFGQMPRFLSRYFREFSFIIIYPETQGLK
ncbi:MAG: cation:proton antiporter [Leptospiraceae bacterium]|nr:cation:proton antiporter [Leptospiraceae bacterium]